MQIRDILAALAIPALVFSAAIPQDPEIPNWDESLPEDNIVGGVAAAQGEFPFLVSVQLNGGHFCGGSLLNANTVLTAAHCVVGKSAVNFKIRAGSNSRTTGGVLVQVSSIKANPSYGATTAENGDVAIMKLATAIPTSSTISYAVLPASGSDPAAGLTTTVAGWGDLTQGSTAAPPLNLRKVDLPVISRASCQSSYGASSITTQMFCAGFAAGGKDSCQGDSGGPIINTSTRVVLGAVSWGRGCAQANAPGVYASLGHPTLRSFITANM